MDLYIAKVDQERYLHLAERLREEAKKIEVLINDTSYPIDVTNIVTWDKLDMVLKNMT